VFGYYIEVSKGNVGHVPDTFIRKQTLVNAERYIVPELKEFENKILSAKEKIEQLEYYLFNEIRETVRKNTAALQTTARAIANIDAVLSLSFAAYHNNYSRPELNNNREIIVKDGRHPVWKSFSSVSSSCLMTHGSIRGTTYHHSYRPNMAGKSTYMRQVALLVLMTQIGSFIPATVGQHLSGRQNFYQGRRK
jgi:DNA mismatch repair protein MutS